MNTLIEQNIPIVSYGPIDTYKEEVDEVVVRNLTYDWEWLRKKEIKVGFRHSTLSIKYIQNPLSVVSNLLTALNHLETYLSVKKRKESPLKQVVPDYKKLKNDYTLLWDMKSNEGYINIVSIMSKVF